MNTDVADAGGRTSRWKIRGLGLNSAPRLNGESINVSSHLVRCRPTTPPPFSLTAVTMLSAVLFDNHGRYHVHLLAPGLTDHRREGGGNATKEKRFLFFLLLMSSAGRYFSHARIDPLTDAETKEIDSGRCEMSGISSGRGSRQGAAADSYRNVPQVSTREISMELFQNEKHREPERVGE